MKKLTFLLSLFVACSSVTFAQNSDKAKALLDEVSKKVRSYDNIEIEFSYVLENTTENIKQETRGDVNLKDDKYRLNLMGTTRLFDGEKLYTIIPEDEEINISTYNPEDNTGITPSEMLTFYEDGYLYKWDIKQNVKGRKIQYVKLIPIDSNAEIKEILLGIDVQTKHIYNLIQTQDNGTKVTIKVNGFKTDQNLSENLFKFNEDKYQGYYINLLD
ncbi:LolA family protein [Mesonia aestuariivivens]|uniref:Outer membrane lipoprotein carrier protein LolA n=1 Tax=Mesonia aestuariivivens TaxID=2796128 RepID=A0ABS6W2E8_9FLAO|nr:outer membrane lipoprotein carrier protein LolA [Mesonia aestuariivivens]MBW2962026.1 outer membrane lipoprotein carrier protein LolA [Mesonia aestuariivivens]